MDGVTVPGLTRRQLLVGGAAGAAALWAVPKLGWSGVADALTLAPADPGAATDDDPSTVVFADDFNQEFPGSLLTRWNVARPVQLVGTSQFGAPCPANSGLDSTDFLAGHGIVVAMDGVIGAGTGPGRIETMQVMTFSGGRYQLSFNVAGSHHRSDPLPAKLIASVPGCGAAMTVVRSAPDDFLPYSLDFVVKGPMVSTIVFESGDTPGQAGLLLDDVSLARGSSS
jgi:hypothetical protein